MEPSFGLLEFILVAVAILLVLVVVGSIVKRRQASKALFPETESPPKAQQPLTRPSQPQPAPQPAVQSIAQRGATIFLGYRRDDSAGVVGRIYDKLLGQVGHDQVFKDVESVPLGVYFRRTLEQVVGDCDIMLAIVGNQWLNALDDKGSRRLDDPADHVRLEIESALKRNIRVVPVLVRGAEMPREADLPDSLKSFAYRNAIEVRNDPDFHNDMNRLITGLGLGQKR